MTKSHFLTALLEHTATPALGSSALPDECSYDDALFSSGFDVDIVKKSVSTIPCFRYSSFYSSTGHIYTNNKNGAVPVFDFLFPENSSNDAANVFRAPTQTNSIINSVRRPGNSLNTSFQGAQPDQNLSAQQQQPVQVPADPSTTNIVANQPANGTAPATPGTTPAPTTPAAGDQGAAAAANDGTNTGDGSSPAATANPGDGTNAGDGSGAAGAGTTPDQGQQATTNADQGAANTGG